MHLTAPNGALRKNRLILRKLSPGAYARGEKCDLVFNIGAPATHHRHGFSDRTEWLPFP